MKHSCYRDDPRCEEPVAYATKLHSESVMITFLCIRHAAEVREVWPDDIEWMRNAGAFFGAT